MKFKYKVEYCGRRNILLRWWVEVWNEEGFSEYGYVIFKFNINRKIKLFAERLLLKTGKADKLVREGVVEIK
jgi:hypothetical protein